MRYILFALALSALPLGAQTFRPGAHLVAVDNNGKLIGQVIDAIQGSYDVSAVVNGKPIILVVQREVILVRDNIVQYTQPNCQGTPFLNYNSNANNGNLAWPAGQGADGNVYIATTRSPVSQVIQSFWHQATLTTPAGCTNLGSSSQFVLPAEQGPNVLGMFVYPFNAVQEGEVVTQQLPPSGLAVPSSSTQLLIALAICIVAIAAIKLR
ncbi:MAG TPA: hypothetical protein VJ276_23305 [Thermoanaerobaculia bacterium]|nr:hypothetical protein [Thermoanaerobaculia bacterium]